MGGRQVLTRDGGSVTVEFFLVVPLLIVVLVGGLQVVSLARARIELLGAVRDGARVAATSPDPAKAVEAVQNALAPSVRDRVRISVSRPGVVGAPARVSARLRHRLGAPFPDHFGVDLSASATMLVER
ncbi:MAG: TadE/TadG family type IV pilus assembly protein [Actinobacteria bacterium]|jgi:Flp pilus assembly protein TadG|nr:TadE/TadG family type IV pilus assembly protein [Actinomycetota bacterium]MCZ6737452.1 TadE/TadG family type IV pilus assembly protein [Actinomycetota bacterium]